MNPALRLSTAGRRTTARFGERRPCRSLVGLAAWLSWSLAFSAMGVASPARAAAAFRQGPTSVCAASGAGCRAVDLWDIRASPAAILLRQRIVVAPAALPLVRSPTLSIVAAASWDVRWNGTPIGGNGRPAADPAGEVPGSYVAGLTVPPALVRPGANDLSIRMSFHHLWLPVRTPVRAIRFSMSRAGDIAELRTYLPALPIFGVLAAVFAYFAFAALADRTNRAARVLAPIAALAGIQLMLETARAFVAYPYPWQLARVGGIALLAATIAILSAAHAADRFLPARRRMATIATAVLAGASVVLLPWFDQRALGAIAAGSAVILVCATAGVRGDRRGAAVALWLAGTTLASAILQSGEFLNVTWFVMVAAALTVSLVDQLLDVDGVRRRSHALAGPLRRADAEPQPILLKDGARTHRVDPRTILAIAAADDYCEVRLVDGRSLLVSGGLTRLIERLPSAFLRVHRSHAVNSVHVASVSGTASGRSLTLVDGTTLPIGRSYAAAAAARLSPPARVACEA